LFYVKSRPFTNITSALLQSTFGFHARPDLMELHVFDKLLAETNETNDTDWCDPRGQSEWLHALDGAVVFVCIFETSVQFPPE
jgi:hypothetical protein